MVGGYGADTTRAKRRWGRGRCERSCDEMVHRGMGMEAYCQFFIKNETYLTIIETYRERKRERASPL